MSQVINTNIASLNAQRNLSTSQSSLQTALQRLSSGLRINSAKDDAAGMAIAARMTSQINGLNQAARNANDGISLAQTAEAGLSSITDNLQRIRELAVQSANATNTGVDRASIQSEVSQLTQEIDRVATSTQFNGLNVLDGSFTSQQFQVGANVGQTITISSIASARASALGQGYGASIAGTVVDGTALSGTGQFTISTNGGAAVDIFTASGGASVAGNAKALAAAINASGVTGLTATAAATTVNGTQTSATVSATGTAVLTLNGTGVNIALTAGDSAAQQVTKAYNAIQSNSAATGVSATLGAGNTLTLTAADGSNIAASFAAGTATGATAAGIGLGGAGTTTTYGQYNLAYSGTGSVVIAGTGTSAAKGVAAGTYASAATGTAISAVDVTSTVNANLAITAVDNALNSINTSRASLGAYQNRFTSVVGSLQTASENITAARSRIQDTDFAAETAALTRGQILQQAGTAMLAQANSLPQSVLALLK